MASIALYAQIQLFSSVQKRTGNGIFNNLLRLQSIRQKHSDGLRLRTNRQGSIFVKLMDK